MPNVEYSEPAALKQYYYYSVDNINVFISKAAKVDGVLKFVLKNFLTIKSVDVEGIKLI